MSAEPEPNLGYFEKYIYLWIALCAVAGLLLGGIAPKIGSLLNSFNVGGVSVPISILMFLIMFPTMAKVKLEELPLAIRNIGPMALTLVANWVIAPPLMVLLAAIFLPDPGLRAGAILLGLSPCTGMVLFWIVFARGNVTQGIVITAVNVISTLLLYAPFAALYLGVSGAPIPFSLVLASTVLFVALPLVTGQGARKLLITRRGTVWFEHQFLPKLNSISTAALLSMLVLLFSFEGQIILEKPLVVVLVSMPLFIHFALMLLGVYLVAWWRGYRYEDAAMAALIGSSTQFEIAIGTALVVFGLGSGAALATVVGPLIEVPVMVTATKLLLRTKPYFSHKRRVAAT